MKKKATARKLPEQKEPEKKKAFERTYRGGCHCGRIRFEVREKTRPSGVRVSQSDWPVTPDQVFGTDTRHAAATLLLRAAPKRI